EVASRTRGSLVSMEGGQSTSYQLENLQQRATLFIGANEKVYEGQIVGENSRPEDMPCNPTKKKAMTNHRSATKEVDTGLKVPRKMGLDAALEWISDDELVEVTPQSIRLRKAILNAENRKQAQKKQLAMAG
ncbi:MAG: translational GTPase TypA, partial [Candidatus Omnitrophica bacterium]|nr:translational GTPase TypA [Candidatus Omnitrophota bacterium]